ncbi:MAG: ABC transporter permease [Planctomycetes bacterium]|nr:ABC transporter permease [Planctomycetota bacterium]
MHAALDAATTQTHRLLTRPHHHDATEQHHGDDAKRGQSTNTSQQQAVAPARSDVEAELVVHRLVDAAHQAVRRGEQTKHTTVERGARRVADATRPIQVQDPVQKDLGGERHLESRQCQRHPFDHRGSLEHVEDDAHGTGQREQRHANHESGTAAQVLPRRLARHARHEPCKDESHQRDRQAHRQLPPQRGTHAEGFAIGACIQLHRSQARPVPHTQARQHGGRTQAHDRHQPLMHQAQPARRRIELGSRTLEHGGVATTGGQFLALHRFQPLQPVLVEHDRKGCPDGHAAQREARGNLKGGVPGRATVDEQQQPGGELEKQAKNRDAGGLLVGNMVHSHVVISVGRSNGSRSMPGSGRRRPTGPPSACSPNGLPFHPPTGTRPDTRMAWIEQLLAICRNTFLECIRQPVALVALVIGLLLIVLSNPFAAFTMQDDQQMYVDIGMSTIFTAGAILAAFLATGVVNREIENRTVLTVVSKPVPRPLFVLGKYLGVAMAIAAVTLWLSLVFMLVEMHGTMPTVRTPWHQPVLAFGSAALVCSFVAATWANYFYGWNFSATVIALGVVLLAVAYLICLPFKPDWGAQPLAASFRPEIWKALGMLLLAELVLAAIAVAASTRMGQVLTLLTVLGLFLVGLLSDWLFARRIEQLTEIMGKLPEGQAHWYDTLHLEWGLFRALQAIVPNFQLFWMADAVTQKKVIGWDYLGMALPYGLTVIVMSLAAGTLMFQRREVG